jgi:hypothetical protein
MTSACVAASSWDTTTPSYRKQRCLARLPCGKPPLAKSGRKPPKPPSRSRQGRPQRKIGQNQNVRCVVYVSRGPVIQVAKRRDRLHQARVATSQRCLSR